MGRSKIKKTVRKEASILRALIKAKNGPTNCSKWLGTRLKVPKFHRQNIVNWRERGYVPLEMVKAVAAAFGVSPYLLNFEGYSQVAGDPEMSWKELVAESSAALSGEAVRKGVGG